MASFERGVNHWRDIAETLNDIIIETGDEVKKDNRKVWDGFLHRWDNQDWEDMLAAVTGVLEEMPSLAKPFHKNNINTARATILKNKHKSDRVLDTKEHKRKAWSMIMTMREIWNEMNDIHLPNRSQPKSLKPRVEVKTTKDTTTVTIFHELFETDE